MNKEKRYSWITCCLLSMLLLLSGCYHRHSTKVQHAALIEYSDRQLDSISFSSTHHYTNRYNFVVFSDSLMLIRQQPEEYVNHLRIDSFAVKKHCLLVVSDIRIIPQDTEDSVWCSWLPRRMSLAGHMSLVCCLVLFPTIPSLSSSSSSAIPTCLSS